MAEDESDVVQVKDYSTRLNASVSLFVFLAEPDMSPISAKVKVKNHELSDYDVGPPYTKEFSLVGRDKKEEKLRVIEKNSLFNKNFKVVIVWIYLYIYWIIWIQVSKCGKSGCKDEPLKSDEEERVLHLLNNREI